MMQSPTQTVFSTGMSMASILVDHQRARAEQRREERTTRDVLAVRRLGAKIAELSRDLLAARRDAAAARAEAAEWREAALLAQAGLRALRNR